MGVQNSREDVTKAAIGILYLYLAQEQLKKIRKNLRAEPASAFRNPFNRCVYRGPCSYDSTKKGMTKDLRAFEAQNLPEGSLNAFPGTL